MKAQLDTPVCKVSPMLLQSLPQREDNQKSLWEQLFRYSQRGSMIIQWLLANRKKNESWGFKSLRSLNSKHMSMGCLSQWPTDRANPRTITSMAKSQSHFLHSGKLKFPHGDSAID